MSLEEVRNYINHIRREMAGKPLSREDLDANPLEQFAKWMEEAVNAQILDPYAMCLSTVNANGHPSSRIVYWRDVDHNGFVFYTNYNSRKGMEIAANPYVALNFHWTELDRQIRIEGPIHKVSLEMSDKYWASRPRESRIGAWASAQSSIVSSPDQLQQSVKELHERFGDGEIPRPPYWGGYVVEPERIEFWQGRPSRLHDRFVYLKSGEEDWSMEQLSP
ncbi:MAG: pyridoxamine 5'-phosphate oxidase [Flavobacteriales bacterium]|nr:pyridoxamine 5'-phosphate oxidase [Flavobacteriales bacterium]